MKKRFLLLSVALLALAGCGNTSSVNSSSSAAPSETPSSSVAPTPSSSETPTPSSSETPVSSSETPASSSEAPSSETPSSSEEVITYSKANEVTTSGTLYHVKAVIVATGAAVFIGADDTGCFYFKGALPSGFAIGDYIKADGKANSNGQNVLQFNVGSGATTIEKITDTADVPPTVSTTATALTAELATAFASKTSTLGGEMKKYSWTSLAGTAGTFTTLNLNGSATVIEPMSLDTSKFTIESGKVYAVEGYFVGYSTSNNFAAMVITKVEASAFAVESVAITDPAEASVKVDEDLTLSAVVTPTGAPKDVTWTAEPATAVELTTTGLEAGQVKITGKVVTA